MRTLAEVTATTGVGPSELLAHPEFLEELVDVLSERNDG